MYKRGVGNIDFAWGDSKKSFQGLVNFKKPENKFNMTKKEPFKAL